MSCCGPIPVYDHVRGNSKCFTYIRDYPITFNVLDGGLMTDVYNQLTDQINGGWFAKTYCNSYDAGKFV